MPIKTEILKGQVPVKIFTDDIDPCAYEQLTQLAQLPIVYPHIAVMPDVHVGIGATVGSVIPTFGAIIPAAVGVDIGCGMNAVRLDLTAEQLPDSMRRSRSAIARVVPVGFNQHKAPAVKRSTLTALDGRLDAIFGKHPKLQGMLRKAASTWRCQLGSLGGENHFVEVCVDEANFVWVMLHSGSRGIGNAIGRYFIELAKRDVQRQQLQLPHRDLAYFREGSEHFDDYIEAVQWAQDYATSNRRELMRLTLAAMSGVLPAFKATREAVNCHHNYVSSEHHFGRNLMVPRKGAIRAGLDELGIIPGSMGPGSYIVRGKGNALAFDSCAHGSGRRMSRTAAKRKFTAADVTLQTEGVECRKDKNIIDEILAAYKDIDEVMAHQDDLVEVLHTLKQIVCVKG